MLLSRCSGYFARFSAMALVCSIAPGCYDVPRRNSVESEYFVVHYREDPPTLAELDALDLHFSTVAVGAMSVPSSVAPIHVHIYRDAADYDENSPCQSGSLACTIGARIHTVVAVDRHELIHAYLGARCGRSIRLLDEGLAWALSSTSHSSWFEPRADLAELTRSCDFQAENRALGGEAAWNAGSFVAWLSSEHGLTPVIDLACDLGIGASENRALSAFEERFGARLPALVEQWQDSYPASPTAPCPWDPLRSRTLEIGQPEELSTPLLLPEPVFLPPTSTFGRVRWSGMFGPQGGLWECGSATASLVLTGGGEFGDAWGPLVADGRYLLDFPPQREGGGGSFSVELFDLMPLADICDPTVTVPIGLGAISLRLFTEGFGIDYPELDPLGNAEADAAGQIVLEGVTAVWAGGFDRIWICPSGCPSVSTASCDQVPIGTPESEEPLVLSPGIYTLVAMLRDWPDFGVREIYLSTAEVP